MSFIEVLILSIVEGLTEFLPVSSTGHLIITSSLFGINEDQFVKSFNIIIQTGAIAAVLVLYWRRFLSSVSFYQKLILAFLPAAVIGLAVKNKIDAVLGNVTVVAVALILGGLVLIWSDRFFEKRSKPTKGIDGLSVRDCLILGFLQCFAFIPGVSRAAATILAGLSVGLDKKSATEFSFFLAVPTLTGASFIKALPLVKTIQPDQIGHLLAGIFLSFIVAICAIKFFINVVSKFGFKMFGYYRILLGLAILALIWTGQIV